MDYGQGRGQAQGQAQGQGRGQVTIRVDGEQLDGTLLSPAKLIPGVLFIHGWGGTQQQDLVRAEEIAQLGCICFTFDLRGHARHKDERNSVTRSDGLADVIAAYCPPSAPMAQI